VNKSQLDIANRMVIIENITKAIGIDIITKSIPKVTQNTNSSSVLGLEDTD
jgi:hypothetical protein